MKRVLRILATLLLGTCLTTIALAFTILRQRSQDLPPTFEEGCLEEGIPMRKRIQVTRHWDVYSLREWKFGFFPYSSHSFSPGQGWQFGPFAFEEEYDDRSWPVAVDKAARTLAAQKLNRKDELVKEPELMIYEEVSFPRSWCAVVSGPDGKRSKLYFDKNGKRLPNPQPIDFSHLPQNARRRSCLQPRSRGLFRW